MESYIKKSALVAEIERRKKQNEEWKNSCKGIDSLAASMVIQEDINILYLLDTLEAKEVDLENELKEDWLFSDKTEVDCLENMCLTEDMFVSLAKKYFELGIKAQKGE